MKRIWGLVALNLFFIAGMSVVSPYFLTRRNISVVVDNMALEAIALSALTLLLIGGYFDLSVDGVVALSGIVAGKAMTSHTNILVAMLLGITAGLAVGAVNGLMVAKLRINGLIATLTTWWICIGICFGVTKAISPYDFPDAFQMLGQYRILGLRILVFYAVAVALVLSFVLHLTPTGAHIYVSGDNREASEMLGVDTTRLGIGLYLLMALAASFIGLMMAARLNAASPMAVDGMTLRVIAAAVLGGCALSGGKGTIVGGLLGLLLMNILGNAIILLGMSPYWQKAVLGSILLVAVLMERLNFSRRSVQRVQVVRVVHDLCRRGALGGLRRSPGGPASGAASHQGNCGST